MDNVLRTSKMLEAKIKETFDKSKDKINLIKNDIGVIEKQNQAIESEISKTKAQTEEKKKWIEKLKIRLEQEKKINECLYEEEKKKEEKIKTMKTDSIGRAHV